MTSSNVPKKNKYKYYAAVGLVTLGFPLRTHAEEVLGNATSKELQMVQTEINSNDETKVVSSEEYKVHILNAKDVFEAWDLSIQALEVYPHSQKLLSMHEEIYKELILKATGYDKESDNEQAENIYNEILRTKFLTSTLLSEVEEKLDLLNETLESKDKTLKEEFT